MVKHTHTHATHTLSLCLSLSRPRSHSRSRSPHFKMCRFLRNGSIQRCLTSIDMHIVEMIPSCDSLISTMGIPMLVRWYPYIESWPCSPRGGIHLHVTFQCKKFNTMRPRQMAANWQTPFSSALPGVKTFEF